MLDCVMETGMKLRGSHERALKVDVGLLGLFPVFVPELGPSNNVGVWGFFQANGE
jgi:hypothetical protein